MELRRRGLHLIALSALAIGQPLLDLLGRSPQFFVSRSSASAEIVFLALGLVLLPGVLLWLLESAVALVAPRLLTSLHLALVGLLAAIIALIPLNRLELIALESSFAGVGELAIALGVGAVFAALYYRSEISSRLVGALVLGPPLFVAVFLLGGDVRKLVLPSSSTPDSAPTAGRERPIEVPVVFVIFDELPTSSLLDSTGAVDPARYPAFAELARGSTWLRGASTNSCYTWGALPAILTGRLPDLERTLPIREEYPENLFSLLQGRMHLNVHEAETALHVEARAWRAGAFDRRRMLVSDLWILYLHMILPTKYGGDLPSVTTAWGHFADTPERAEVERERQASKRLQRAAVRVSPGRDEPGRLRFFIDSIGTTSKQADDRASLHFYHGMLPHAPWMYLPSGSTYSPTRAYGRGPHGWTDEAWWSLDAYRRHLSQLELADRLLGELMAELHSLGLWEPALLIVASDHGVSFWPNSVQRFPGGHPHPEDILGVPLFIKQPGQIEGEISDRTVELVDLLPTIADILDVEIPWSVDGCSVFASDCPDRLQRTVLASPHPKTERFDVYHFSPESVFERATLQRKLDFFGSGRRPFGLYRFGPFAELAGREIGALVREEELGGVVEIEHGARREGEAGAAGGVWMPTSARVVGILHLEEPALATPHVAVAVNGRIETIVPAPSDGEVASRVVAMIPEASLVSGGALGVYLVDPETGVPVLVPLAIR